jgi:predicted nucleotidyltransferase
MYKLNLLYKYIGILSINFLMCDCDEGWTLVKKKQRNKKALKQQIKLNGDDVVKQLLYMVKYNPRGVFLFGSTAKGTNTEDSDLDILIIWNKRVPNYIIDIKTEISNMFNKKVDLISMIYNGTLMLSDDVTETVNVRTLFLYNVITEALPVIGDINEIELSEYIMKN